MRSATIKLNARLSLRHNVDLIICMRRRWIERCDIAVARCAAFAGFTADLEGQVMDDKKHAHEARKAFRSSDKKAPLTEHEEKQRAVLKNLERLKAERLAREAAKSKDD
ncbi:MAG TPA: hypothetical protein VFB02_24480 [Bradyrhizobium sp.]|nr:hypothetical protein [Bradyrhizobium sp.]